MDPEKEERLKEEAREITIKEGSAYAVSDGLGIRGVTPYLLAIGKNSSNINLYIGLLSSLPSLLGNFIQLLSARLIEKYSRKKIVFLSVFFQAIVWLAMLIPGILYFYLGSSSDYSAMLVVIIYTLLAVAGSSAGPAWNSWMGAIAPAPNKRASFFGRRNKQIGAISLVFGLIGSFILDYFQKTHIFVAFIILFGVSFIFRLRSAYYFKKEYEPKLELKSDYYFSFFSFIKKMHSNNFGKFTLFVAMFSGAVAIASPFFAVYMLTDLQLSYTFYMIITLAASLASLLSMPLWGKIIDNFGMVKVMKFTGLFAALSPLFWLPSLLFTNLNNVLFFLVFVELFSGFVWGGFNLAISNFIFSAVTKERIGICTSYYSLIISVFVFFSALAGGYLASIDYGLAIPSVFIVFIVSAFFRLAIYFSALPKIHEVGEFIDGSVNSEIKKSLSEERKHIEARLRHVINLRFSRPKGVQ